MAKILILGGTGAMGIHMVQLLKGTDDEVYITSRRQLSDDGNIKYIKGNAQDDEFLIPLLAQHFDVVVDFMSYNTQKFKSRVEMLLSKVDHLIFLSSARVYADNKGLIREDSDRLIGVSSDQEYLATDEYALSKGREENILKESKYKNWTIVRPYITYSENRLQLGVLEKEDWLYRALHGRSIVFSEDIASKYTTLTYGYDVAKGIIALINEPKALGQAFHITAKESILWKDVLAIYLDEIEKVTGKRPKVLMTRHAFNLQLPYRKWQVKYDRLFNRRFDNSKISQFTDTTKFIRTEEGLRKCITYFVEHPIYNNINWNVQSAYDKMAGEWASPKEFSSKKQMIKYYIKRLIK